MSSRHGLGFTGIRPGCSPRAADLRRSARIPSAGPGLEPGPAAVSGPLERGMGSAFEGGTSFQGLHPPNASLQGDVGRGEGSRALVLGWARGMISTPTGRGQPPPPCARPESANARFRSRGRSPTLAARGLQGSQPSPCVSQPIRTCAEKPGNARERSDLSHRRPRARRRGSPELDRDGDPLRRIGLAGGRAEHQSPVLEERDPAQLTSGSETSSETAARRTSSGSRPRSGSGPAPRACVLTPARSAPSKARTA